MCWPDSNGAPTSWVAGLFGKSLIKMGFPHFDDDHRAATAYPRLFEISVELVAGPYDYIERAMMGRTADFGFVRLPTEDLGFEVMSLLSSGMLCAVLADHHLAAQERIGAEDLVRTALVLLGRLRHNRQEIEKRLRNAQGNVQCRVEPIRWNQTLPWSPRAWAFQSSPR